MIRIPVSVVDCDVGATTFGMDGGSPVVEIQFFDHAGGEVDLVCRSLGDIDRISDQLDDAAVWFKQRETRYGIRSVQ